MVGQVNHRLEDPAHRGGAYFVAKAGRVKRAGIERCPPGPVDEVVEEALGVVRRMGEDLPAQEAVFGGDVALDVGEAQDPAWILVGQQQRGQAAHGMPDQVETPDSGSLQHSLGGLYQERYRYL